MLLAIDVGNTQTVFGLYDGDRLTEHWRIFTDVQRTGDELGVLLRGFVELGALDGIVLCSSVPPLDRPLPAGPLVHHVFRCTSQNRISSSVS